MNEITPIPGRGHNGPPSDPLDEALAPYGDDITEAEGWLDGKAVETEGQMKAVDALRKALRGARQAVEKAEEAEAKPLHEAWKKAKARFKPTLDDVSRLEKGLVALVDGFKRKLAAEKAEAERIGLDFRNAPRAMTQTANGAVPVHRVSLNAVRVGEVEVNNIDAIVMPAQMPYVLLGNSFLSRFQMRRDNDLLRLERRP